MIYLYGKLRKVFGDSIDCEVSSVQELMRAAEANRPGFKDYIEKDRKYVIRRGDEFRKGKDVAEEEVEMRFSETSWHVVPMPAGYSGAMRTILGVVMFAVGTAMYWTPAAGFAPYVQGIGLSLTIGGISSLLAPSPSISNTEREDPANRPSYIFDGPTNRVSPGSAVPLVYGFYVFVGSIFTSGGINVIETVNSSATVADPVETSFPEYEYVAHPIAPPDFITSSSADWWENKK